MLLGQNSPKYSKIISKYRLKLSWRPRQPLFLRFSVDKDVLLLAILYSVKNLAKLPPNDLNIKNLSLTEDDSRILKIGEI